ncbi:MAG: T9SS type A sorting domain-containing protein [Bacteroidetes bacterium]|nr:T9SS type A sorting domain-containing protein [Bacteroidota bacterium]
MKNLLSKKFYAFIVTAMLFSASANAQIIYTDVNPDTTVICSSSPCTQSYNLDLNNDGMVDFILNTYFDSLHCTASVFSPLAIKQRVYITPQSGKGTVSPMMNTPLMMNSNDTVGSNLTFSANPAALRFISFDACPDSGGSWTSTSDHYLGLKITVGNSTYYGWARLNVFVTGIPPVYFTLKDYAYNSIHNQTILAGQTTATGINENSFASSISLFPNPATNHLTIVLGSNNKNVEVTIADITGKIIYSTTAYETQKIEVNTKDFTAGIYVVKIQTADFTETKKLVIEK